MSDLPIVTGSDGKPREAQAVTLFDKATGSSAQLRSTIIPLTASVARPIRPTRWMAFGIAKTTPP